jgi:hypothetical protein
MKRTLACVVCLLVLPVSVAAQSVCPQPKSEVVVHRFGFTVHSVSWPSAHGVLKATAAIPDVSKRSYGIVFSFSTLVSLEPKQSLDMLPLAMELTKQGKPTIVIERTLTWPEIDQSVGTMQADVICAEQWLSKHAAVSPYFWWFIGPDSDAPKLVQSDELGRERAGWGVISVGERDGDADNTKNFLRGTSEVQKWLRQNFFVE